MASYTVRITFTPNLSGASTYTFPLVQSVGDPEQGMKATVIEGKRGDGSIIIPGGKKSQRIELEGILYDDDYDYVAIQTAMEGMRTDVTTDTGTLVMEYWNGASWVNTWSYTVRRIGEISFPPSMRVDMQKYKVTFLVVLYS